MLLVDKDTKIVAVPGMLLTDFRGGKWILVRIDEPVRPNSTGRIQVRDQETGSMREFFPNVCNLVWAEKGIYKVEITETLQKTYEIEASSASEAISTVKARYYDQDIILDDDAYIDTEYNIVNLAAKQEVTVWIKL